MLQKPSKYGILKEDSDDYFTNNGDEMAKTFSYLYKNNRHLRSFIEKHQLYQYSTILVQVFSDCMDKARILSLQAVIKEQLPSAHMIGCTTAGQIHNGKIKDKEIMMSFTIFKKVEIESCLIEIEAYGNSFQIGKRLGESLSSLDTKAFILFPTRHQIDTQSLLDGIYQVNPNLLLAGGVAGENELGESFVFTNNSITTHGVAAVALNGENLFSQLNTDFRWQEIGKSFRVTKCNENIIYAIDNKKPLTLLKYYFGERFVKGLPLSGNEFPLLVHQKGKKNSAFIINILKNGAIELNRQIHVGEQLTFGYANFEEVVQSSYINIRKLSQKPVDTVFAYNCMARKKTIKQLTENELAAINQIASVNGFFSYGEISGMKMKRPQLLGYTLSGLVISEWDHMEQENKMISTFQYDFPDYFHTILALTHFMKASKNDIEVLDENRKVSEQYYRSLFNNNTDIVYSTNLQGLFTSVNAHFEKTFSIKEKEIIGTSSLEFVKNNDVSRVKRHFYKTITGKEQYYHIQTELESGEIRYFQIKNIPITLNEEIVGVYGIGRDITEQKIMEEKMIKLAYYDAHTGLPNRLKLTEILEEMLKRAKKKKRLLAVSIIAINRFHLINDTFGHDEGDNILKELAARIRADLPKGVYFGHFGSDHFALVITKDVERKNIAQILNSVLQNCSKPIMCRHKEMFLTASVGVSIFPRDGEDVKLLFKNADIAKNYSKNQGGNQFTYFSVDMNDDALKKLELESQLRKALALQEFELNYQPQLDLISGNITGCEALIRWQHPTLGLISPDQFIPLAEETDLISQIGNWVLRTACHQNKQWQLAGLGMLSIGVNVSAFQFQEPGFIDQVKKILNETHLEAKYLTLELTESTMVQNIEYNISVMKALQELGVKVAIDDFGTGYSSLSYLKNLPIDILKIDRSFIQNLHIDPSDMAIVNAIVMMGHGLSLKIVAEGVETKPQIELLKGLRCHYAQGYYIHRPLSREQFELDFIKKWSMI
ncbi:EAL domain-containing protein [Bacillus sp. 03113]|uniref:bifunctional diguanylate cyclase/phosphodiesterase n=1 Tax=Bacillus sp. 03113 TaxID=2578211 RepID=UPI00215C9BF7|nr:EAL domain-containing protein [Bacillus sp. 03113]